MNIGKLLIGLMLFFASGLGFSVDAYALVYTPITFDYNGQRVEYPTGNITLGSTTGSVPFSIPSGSNNMWNSDYAPPPKHIVIPVNIYGVAEVHTLMNLYWGQINTTQTYLTFTGSNGASYTKNFVDGFDVRDWFNGYYVNSLNSPDSEEVFSGWYAPWEGTYRLDKQKIALPDEFETQYLSSITIFDDGDHGDHRAFLYGLTVGAEPEGNGGGTSGVVPEPASLSLLGLGLSGLFLKRRKKRV